MQKPYLFRGNNCCEETDFDIQGLIHKDGLDKNRIYLWGDVNEDSAGFVIAQLHYLAETKNQKHINLIIHSCGGDIDGLNAIVDEIQVLQTLGVVISTVVFGNAYSAAAAILSLGTKGYRYARPNAAIMLHPASYGMGEDYSGNQEKLAAFFKKKNELLHRIVAKAIGSDEPKKYKKFLSDIDKGLWLTATEAVKYGIVDSILTTPLSFGERNNDEKRSEQPGL